MFPRGLIFWYFRTKEELVVEVAKRVLPTDVMQICIDKGLTGRELLQCVGLNYADKYSDKRMRMLLIHTLSLANVNEVVKEELSRVCSHLLDVLVEKVFWE